MGPYFGPIFEAARRATIMGAHLVRSFLGPENDRTSGHGPECVSEADERTEVTPKPKPYPMPATVSLRDIACSYTSFVLRHTSTLNLNPKLQRHLDPAGFLYRVSLARSRQWCDNAGQNHLFRFFQHFSRSGFGLAPRRCSTTYGAAHSWRRPAF